MLDVSSEEGLLHSLRRLYRHLSPRRRWQLGGVLALMLVGAVAELATLGAVLPFLALMADPGRAVSYPALQGLFAFFGWQRPTDILLPATILFAVIALLAGAIRLLLAWVSQKFIFRLGHDLTTEVYRRTLYQPYAYHVSKNSSELIAAISKVRTVSGGVLVPLMLSATSAVISVFLFAGLLLVNWSIALIAGLGFCVVYFIVAATSRRRLQQNSSIAASATTVKIQVAQEGLGGIRDVLIERAQPIYVSKFGRTSLAETDAIVVNTFFAIAPRYVVESFGMILIATIALAMVQASGGLSVALPTLGALALGAQRLLPLVQQLYAGWSQILGNQRSLLDVLAYLDLPIDQERTATRRPTPLPFHLDITFDAVSFHYGPTGPLVIDGLDLRIAKGERVALVGKTGSGKSTIMDLAMGLLVPTAGRIRIDGTELTPETMAAWQANIAHVPQAIYLSDASIAENIAFAVPTAEIDMASVREAARKAQIADFIEGLPRGYETEVGERGVRLSGGQRQRIGLARALYRRASVLVLDEATSALDNETEAAVMDAIRGLDRELTILLVAHRLTTVEMCDRVLEVVEGRVIDKPPACRDPKLPKPTIARAS
jgi:ABC-type multidrug transport system fused ATPase/permease subunit